MKTVTIEIPDDVLEAMPRLPEDFNRELRLAVATLWYARREISLDKAAGIAGLTRDEFLTALDHTSVGPGPIAGPNRLHRSFSEEAEMHYRAVGRWKGPGAAKEAQEASRSFWRDSGERGARWLIRRLLYEHRVDALHGGASLLSDLGEVSFKPILKALRSDPAPDQACSLLQALAWLGEATSANWPTSLQAELTLADYLQRDDPDLREAAARAMRLLIPTRAVLWLKYRLRDEADPDVRKALEEELAHHKAVRT